MKRMFVSALGTLILSGMVFAQSVGTAQTSTSTTGSTQQMPAATEAQAASNSAGGTNAAANTAQGAVADGTAITAQLAKGIDSKKAKEGDAIQAKVVQDVVSGGKVIVPRNSKLMGHVTQAKAGGKGEAGTLGIAWDKAVLKSGQEVPLHAAIQALAPAPRMPAGQSAYPSGDESSMGGSQMGGMSAPQPAGGGGYTTTGGQPAQPMGGVTGSSAGPPSAGPTNTAANPAGAAANVPGMTTSGQLTPASRGVMGLPGVTLDASAGNSPGGSIITNQKNSVKLEGGTQLVLRVTAQ